MLIKDFENQAQTNADGILAHRENAIIKETVVSPPETFAAESDSMDSKGPGPLKSLLDDPTTPSEVDEATGASSAEESSNLGPEFDIPGAVAERYAKMRLNSLSHGVSSPSSSTKIHEPGQRQTSNKKDFYSKMATRIRDKGLAASKQPTSCACQTELQELQKATRKMNDSLGSLTQTLEQVVKKLDTAAQDAKIHRKGI
ncbi:hypothetical protein TGAMA5MH_10588 [Trichoderma gamsii]|uniref:Uncharacterized protein n=1 Tax=Trichoderma gamsii TaxID=398673 RepID=A0A2K0SW37_9HYPO|nr:hypothetical protein TGAMA5MH_10588 [Trichoderma gamsii]